MYSNVVSAVDHLETEGDFERVKRILAYVSGDPMLREVFEDDEQACLAFHFDNRPRLAEKEEKIKWQMSEIRNAYRWLHGIADAQIIQLRDAGFPMRLIVDLRGVTHWQSGYVPEEIVSEASRFGAKLFVHPVGNPR